MSQRHNNRYAMQMAVNGLMQKNRSKWAENEFLSESMQFISPRLQRAQELFDQKEGEGTKGLTLSKNAQLDSIGDRAYLTARRLCLYGRRSNQPTVLATADHPRSYFDRGDEPERIGRSAAIVALAQRHLANLGPYKITEPDLAALAADIERVRPLSGERDAFADEINIRNKSLPQLLHEVQDKLDELDDEIISLMDEHPEFQDAYFAARVITDRRATVDRKMSNE